MKTSIDTTRQTFQEQIFWTTWDGTITNTDDIQVALWLLNTDMFERPGPTVPIQIVIKDMLL